MLIYGGETDNGTDDSLWSFNTTTLSWNKVTFLKEGCARIDANSVSVQNLFHNTLEG